jgi:hypothetical protein
VTNWPRLKSAPFLSRIRHQFVLSWLFAADVKRTLFVVRDLKLCYRLYENRLREESGEQHLAVTVAVAVVAVPVPVLTSPSAYFFSSLRLYSQTCGLTTSQSSSILICSADFTHNPAMAVPTSTLLTLPPEIRTAIYSHLFDSPFPIHLRTPSHRRLKCSRIDKDDPRGILAACMQLAVKLCPSSSASICSCSGILTTPWNFYKMARSTNPFDG